MTNSNVETEETNAPAMAQPEPSTLSVSVIAGEESVPETVIDSARGWDFINFRELWNYRELLVFLAIRDVKVRYKQTVLGAAWAVFQPVLMMTVFWLFLGKVAKLPTGSLPYPLFVYAGLLPWFLFSSSVTAAANSLLDSERLITKIYFPRLAIPFAASGPALVDFTVATVVLFGLMAFNGVAPGCSVALLPLAVGLIVLSALGAGAFLAALNVAYRDFRYVAPFLIQAWLFATPSIYLATGSAEDLPEAVQWVMMANPMTGLIDFFRAALFGAELPWKSLAVSAIVALVFFLLGCLYFRRVEDSFSDII
jgi:lipopolysaccharide transport system permease protein